MATGGGIWAFQAVSRLLHKPPAGGGPYFPFFAPVDAGWSSPVARQAHNLKVIGSNPIPATKLRRQVKDLAALPFLCLCLEPASGSTGEAREGVIIGKSAGWRAGPDWPTRRARWRRQSRHPGAVDVVCWPDQHDMRNPLRAIPRRRECRGGSAAGIGIACVRRDQCFGHDFCRRRDVG
jgi:hypothetical protein